MEDPYSVENIDRLGVFMFQTSDNSRLCIDSQYILFSVAHYQYQFGCGISKMVGPKKQDDQL